MRRRTRISLLYVLVMVHSSLAAVLAMASCASSPEANPRSRERAEAVRRLAQPLTGSDSDYDDLMAIIGDNRFVLLGESTHGTREFYRERARVTRRLIEEKGFTIVLLEADWPDAYDVNRFIQGRGAGSASEALGTFTRFPRWMWANEEIRQLADWLRTYNQGRREATERVGIYGMDLFSIKESMGDVVGFLREQHPAAAKRAEDRYRCLQRYADDMARYGAEVAHGRQTSCRTGAVAQLEEMGERVAQAGPGHRPGDDRLISAWQNARVVVNGEAYYRAAYRGGVASWNLRDVHMADTIDAVARHLSGPGRAKVVVWAHNSHLGDARATERSTVGELNVGQLMRQRHDGHAILVGFTTYGGTVRAASAWGAEGAERRLTPARPDSFSAIFHETGIAAFMLRLRGSAEAAAALGPPRLERFVGVVYVPSTERQSHYFSADLARQYDAVVHIDQTTAVEPIADLKR